MLRVLLASVPVASYISSRLQEETYCTDEEAEVTCQSLSIGVDSGYEIDQFFDLQCFRVVAMCFFAVHSLRRKMNQNNFVEVFLASYAYC